MHKLESDLENETHKILCEIEKQTDHLIPTRRTGLMLINKKKKSLQTVWCNQPLPRPTEKKIKDRQILGPCQRTKKELSSIRVILIAIAVSVIGMVLKSFEIGFYIYQPLCSGRIWNKVNFFKRSLTGLNSELSFS